MFLSHLKAEENLLSKSALVCFELPLLRGHWHRAGGGDALSCNSADLEDGLQAQGDPAQLNVQENRNTDISTLEEC